MTTPKGMASRIMSTPGRTRTTDIGYAKQKQYGAANARRHAVFKNENDVWVLLCNAKPATREYKGWHETVECVKCQAKLEEK